MSDAVPWPEIGELVEAFRALDRRAADQDRRLEQVLEAVRLGHDGDRALRDALRTARASADYAAAFEDACPLVSIIVPTWNGVDGLRDVSLPSALAQSHPRVEVVVVGDASPPEVEEVVASFGDPRIRFHNLPTRGPYPEDTHQAWLSSGTPPYNAAAGLARGSWIAPLGDDDAFTPDHVERLLRRAVAERLEFVYGRFSVTTPTGERSILGGFPPAHGRIGMQMGIYPTALRIFELELGDAVFGVPNDWGVLRRMLRAGVRFGMVDEVVTNYFPSGRGERGHVDGAEPPTLAPPGTALAARVVELEGRETDLVQRVADLERRLADAERRHADVVGSKSWRLTRPLRGVAARRRAR